MVNTAPNHLVIPGLRAMASHSWLNVVVGKLGPAIIFLAFLGWFGQTIAIVAALGWSFAVLFEQKRNHERVSGLVMMSIITNVGRSVLAIATGSVFVYFLQPTITTVLVGLALAISVPLGAPLAEKLVHDFCPLDDDTASHPELVRFFKHATLLWAFTSMINAAITVYLLMTQSVTSFVLIKSFLGPTTTTITAAIGFVWFRRTMNRAGVDVVVAKR